MEEILDPQLPIVDAHHHLWFLTAQSIAEMESQSALTPRLLAPALGKNPRYLLDEFVADFDHGHNLRATVFVEGGAMYRVKGDPKFRSLGEIEFANGVAAMAASELFCRARVCAAIVGSADLMLGDGVVEVLDAHIAAGGGRYRGVRCDTLHDGDTTILGETAPRMLADPVFRRGFRHLGARGLSFDALLLEPQLPELLELAQAFPDIQIVLNHLGAPIGIGRYSGFRQERFPLWCRNIKRLARCANVSVKLGGLGIPFSGFPSYLQEPPATAVQLADEWRPYIETCIAAFGVERCMFESNFPVDASVCTYNVLWNAFKRVVIGASSSEKRQLFSGTASRVYRLKTEAGTAI